MSERPPTKNPWLRMAALPRAIGVVLVIVGGVWVAQGIGVAKGSVMTGKAMWAVIGGVLLIAGLIVLRRGMNAAKAAIAADPPRTPPAVTATPPETPADPQ